MQDKQVYGYHPETGEFYGAETARVCPVTFSTLIYPAHTTDIEPPAPQEGFAIIWGGDIWGYTEDYRGKALYDVESGELFGYMQDLGAIPAHLTLEKPVIEEGGQE